MELISVIIPVYNVEKYLKRCLDSVLGQTYHHLEIILVDDGSTDTCPLVLDAYAKKDARVKVIHKQNEGVSVARNVGLETAMGEYVCFVDGDDFLPKTSIEKLYNGITKSGADLSLGCWALIMPKSTRYNVREEKLIAKENVDEYAEILDAPEMKGPVAKLFRMDKVKNQALCFPQDVLVSEDTLFVYEYLKNCDSVYAGDANVYFYNKLSIGSATTKFYSRFHEIAFLCTQKYLENVATAENNLSNVRIQQKIVGDFMAVKGYLAHFASDEKTASENLQQAYRWYKPYFCMDVIENNPEKFQAFLHDYTQLEQGIFYVGKRGNTRKNGIKYAVLKAWIKIKTYAIFSLRIAYRNV